VQADLKVINDVLTKLIREAQSSREAADVEDLQDIDYTASSDPSLLRFLVDLRGEETTNKQVRETIADAAFLFFTPGSLQRELRAGGRVHTPSRVVPHFAALLPTLVPPTKEWS